MTRIGEGRWSTYVLARDLELLEMLASHFSSRERRTAFILGRGFDPRMNNGITKIVGAAARNSTFPFLLEFHEGEDSPSSKYQDQVMRNLDVLKSLVPADHIASKQVKMWSSDGRRQTSRSAERVFRRLEEFRPFTDIVVDISALPRSIYFPVIAKLLYLLDSGSEDGLRPNLLILVSEDPDLDSKIVEEGVDEDADYLHPFRGGADREATASLPRIWYPILGERQEVQLERISQLVNPNEICPVLPFPSKNPRRGDDLIIAYRELLFDRFLVEPRNLLYASELNPFEAYRQLRRAILHYDMALQPLGGCRHVLSSISSKLLSLAALLVAYELKQAEFDIGIAHIESHGYDIKQEINEAATPGSSLYGLWLYGEFYG